ncbi:hypothetical protein AB0C34_18660 [Nocardia sp. NPDC049220]|uniref:hypothetical protein n=1 Tax=Nocardia sp. NPDC049220 TaxID=3155273 RepID=UPI00340BBF7F
MEEVARADHEYVEVAAARIGASRLLDVVPATERHSDDLDYEYAAAVVADRSAVGARRISEYDERMRDAMWRAASKSGSISVETTEQGLPVGITVERAELRREPGELAREILRLCKQSANRAGLARRAELAEAGLTSDVLALTGLPKPEDVARKELMDEVEYEVEPQSWLRSV